MCSFCLCFNPRLQLYKERGWIGKLLVQPYFHSCGLFIGLKALRLCWHSCTKAFFLLVIKKNITLRVLKAGPEEAYANSATFFSCIKLGKCRWRGKEKKCCGDCKLSFVVLSLFLRDKRTRLDKKISKWVMNFGCPNLVFLPLMNAYCWLCPDKRSLCSKHD